MVDYFYPNVNLFLLNIRNVLFIDYSIL